MQHLNTKCSQSVGLSALSPATQRCSVVCSAGLSRRLGRVSHRGAAHLSQHWSRASGPRVPRFTSSCPARCQQEDSVHAPADVDEVTSTSGTTRSNILQLQSFTTCGDLCCCPTGPEALPEAPTSVTEVVQPGSQRQRWSLASWMLGRGDGKVGLGTAVMAAAGASSAGFLGAPQL